MYNTKHKNKKRHIEDFLKHFILVLCFSQYIYLWFTKKEIEREIAEVRIRVERDREWERDRKTERERVKARETEKRDIESEREKYIERKNERERNKINEENRKLSLRINNVVQRQY